MSAREAAIYNADAVEELAVHAADDVRSGDHESAMLALEALMQYASRLMKNLEDLS